MDKQLSQKSRVLDYLKDKRVNNQQLASELFNAWRLSDIIFKLRREGHDIITTPTGKSGMANYRMVFHYDENGVATKRS